MNNHEALKGHAVYKTVETRINEPEFLEYLTRVYQAADAHVSSRRLTEKFIGGIVIWTAVIGGTVSSQKLSYELIALAALMAAGIAVYIKFQRRTRRIRDARISELLIDYFKVITFHDEPEPTNPRAEPPHSGA